MSLASGYKIKSSEFFVKNLITIEVKFKLKVKFDSL